MEDDNRLGTVILEELEREKQVLLAKLDELRKGNNSFLYSALCKAQAEFPLVKKNSIAYGNRKYASYADSVMASRPILVRHGLSVLQFKEVREGKEILLTRLCHTSGQVVQGESLLVLGDGKVEMKTGDLQKEIGSAQSYTYRRDYNSIIGLVMDDE